MSIKVVNPCDLVSLAIQQATLKMSIKVVNPCDLVLLALQQATPAQSPEISIKASARQTASRLDEVNQLSQQTAQQQQQLASRFDGLVSETQRLFNRLGEQQSPTQAAVESLKDAVTRLTRNAEADRANFLQKTEADQARWIQNTEEIDSLTDILMHSIQNAEADREIFQAEIRRIWEHVLGEQRGNGRGEG